jgi:hypothetical protein
LPARFLPGFFDAIARFWPKICRDFSAIYDSPEPSRNTRRVSAVRPEAGGSDAHSSCAGEKSVNLPSDIFP